MGRTRPAEPHRIHLVSARDPCARRVRNRLLHSEIGQRAVAIRAEHGGRRTNACDVIGSLARSFWVESAYDSYTT